MLAPLSWGYGQLLSLAPKWECAPQPQHHLLQPPMHYRWSSTLPLAALPAAFNGTQAHWHLTCVLKVGTCKNLLRDGPKKHDREVGPPAGSAGVCEAGHAGACSCCICDHITIEIFCVCFFWYVCGYTRECCLRALMEDACMDAAKQQPCGHRLWLQVTANRR